MAGLAVGQFCLHSSFFFGQFEIIFLLRNGFIISLNESKLVQASKVLRVGSSMEIYTV